MSQNKVNLNQQQQQQQQEQLNCPDSNQFNNNNNNDFNGNNNMITGNQLINQDGSTIMFDGDSMSNLNCGLGDNSGAIGNNNLPVNQEQLNDSYGPNEMHLGQLIQVRINYMTMMIN